MECTLPFQAVQPGMQIPADSMLASLCARGQPGRPARCGAGSGVEPTSTDQQIELYESLFSACRPFLLTETHTANLSTGAWNINGPFGREATREEQEKPKQLLHPAGACAHRSGCSWV